MKLDAYPILKTILFTLENGKNLVNAINLLAESANKKKERKVYVNIQNTLKNGESFSIALKKYCECPMDVVNFISIAEDSLNFKEALKKVLRYLDVKKEFQQESSDKVSVPLIYFILATLVVIAVKFFAVPYQIERAKNYSQEIINLISAHLSLAEVLSNVLFALLIVTAGYFFTLLIALFNNSRFFQAIAKRVVLFLPVSSRIIMNFEKFIVFSILGQMLTSGVSLKKAISVALKNSDMPLFKNSFSNMLNQMKIQGELKLPLELFSEVEQNLLKGVGSNLQMGQVLLEISENSRFEALNQSKQFFRLITVSAILIMTFAVIIEFYVVVLTQLILQKGLLDLVNSGGAL